MKSFLFGAAALVATLAISSSAFACTNLIPAGSGSTRIREEPYYGSRVLQELTSGVGILRHCRGASVVDLYGKRDNNGLIFVWIPVVYQLDDEASDTWHAGYVAKGVVLFVGSNDTSDDTE